MRAPATRDPVAAFPIPDGAPEPVRIAAERFADVSYRWAELKGDLSDAREQAATAHADAIRAAADAIAEGRKPVDVGALKAKAAGRVDELRAQVEASGLVVHAAGDELAAAIDAHRDEWAAGLTEQLPTARERLAAALAETRDAVRTVAMLSGAVEWLDTFDVKAAYSASQRSYSGARARVAHRFPGTMIDEWDADQLLAAVAKLLEDREPYRPRTHKLAATA
jgi:hypothetical protein